MKKCIFIRFFGCIVALCVFVATISQDLSNALFPCFHPFFICFLLLCNMKAVPCARKGGLFG